MSLRKVFTPDRLEGGTSTDLDSFSTAILTTGYLSITTEGGITYVHKYDSTGTAAHNPPLVIRPTDYTTGGTWTLQNGPIGTVGIDSPIDIGNAGTSLDLSCVLYDTHIFTCDQSTLTLAVSDLAIGRTINIIMTNGGSCTITWPTGVQWPYGTEPEWSTSGTDRFVMQRISSTVIHAGSGGLSYA